jgi:hypothetical protein
MGRTVSPFSFVLSDDIAGLRPWRKQMSDEDRFAFDRIFEAAHFHMPACIMMSAVVTPCPALVTAPPRGTNVPAIIPQLYDAFLARLMYC